MNHLGVRKPGPQPSEAESQTIFLNHDVVRSAESRANQIAQVAVQIIGLRFGRQKQIGIPPARIEQLGNLVESLKFGVISLYKKMMIIGRQRPVEIFQHQLMQWLIQAVVLSGLPE